MNVSVLQFDADMTYNIGAISELDGCFAAWITYYTFISFNRTFNITSWNDTDCRHLTDFINLANKGLPSSSSSTEKKTMEKDVCGLCEEEKKAIEETEACHKCRYGACSTGSSECCKRCENDMKRVHDFSKNCINCRFWEDRLKDFGVIVVFGALIFGWIFLATRR